MGEGNENVHQSKQHPTHSSQSLYLAGNDSGRQKQRAAVKNYKVTATRGNWYGEWFYDWYWAADLRSWWMHHFWGASCNTYVRNGAIESGEVKPRPVVFK